MADSLGGEIGMLLKGFEGSFLYRFGWAAVIEKIFDLSSYVLSTSRIRFSGELLRRTVSFSLIFGDLVLSTVWIYETNRKGYSRLSWSFQRN